MRSINFLLTYLLDENAASQKWAQQPPTFRPMSVVAKRLDGSRCHLVRRYSLPRRYCVGWGRSSRPPKRGHSSSPTFRPISIAAKRSPISETAELLLLLLLLLLQQLHWLPLRQRVEFKFAVLVCKAHNNLAPPL